MILVIVGLLSEVFLSSLSATFHRLSRFIIIGEKYGRDETKLTGELSGLE